MLISCDYVYVALNKLESARVSGEAYNEPQGTNFTSADLPGIENQNGNN